MQKVHGAEQMAAEQDTEKNVVSDITVAVVKVVMCSRGGAQPLRSRRTKISIQCCTQKLHFKLTAYFPLAFKSRFMMKTAQETASRKRK